MASHAMVSFKDKWLSAKESSKRARHKVGETISGVVTALESAAAGFGFGVWEGHSGPAGAKMLGLNGPAVIGVGLHGLALMGAGGKAAEHHCRVLGTAALTVAGAAEGMRFGARWKAEGKIPSFSTSGDQRAIGDGLTSAGPEAAAAVAALQEMLK